MSNVELTINPVTNQPINITLTPKASRGDPGPSGVYIGTEEPTDPDVNVWIKDNGAASELTAANVPVVDVAEHYTANPKNTETILAEAGDRLETVEEAIENIPTGTAAGTTLADAGGYFTAPVEGGKNVELALAELGIKLKPVLTYTYNLNTEIRPTAVDITNSGATPNTFTLAGHGLVNNTEIYAVINTGEEWQQYLPNIVCGGMANTQRFFVVNKTNDTFQISTTSGGAALDITTDGGIPNAKWHFETIGTGSWTNAFSVTGIPSLTKMLLRIKGKTITNAPSIKVAFNSIGNVSEWMGTTTISQVLYLQIANGNGNLLYRNDITIDTSHRFSFFQFGYSYGSNSASANYSSNIDVKNFCPNRADTVITSMTFTDQRFANGTGMEVYKL
jgi:hypothetical protein